MTKAEVVKKVVDVGLVPVVRASSAAQAIAAAEAICLGGIPVVEVTMTVPGAIDVIAQLVKKMGDSILIGAGTVLDAATARKCLDAGAQFIVSPGFDLETVKLANREDVMMIAGAMTPTEVITAWNAGSDLVKIFPCGNLGGGKYIKALKGPLPQVPMVPTGGVNLNTAAELIQAGSAALGVGGELVLTSALKSGNTQEIVELAKQYIAIIREARQAKA